MKFFAFSRTYRFTAAPLTALVAACTSPDPELSQGSEGLVDDTDPFREGTVVGPITPLDVHGRALEGSLVDTSPGAVHNGVFSDGLDLAEPPLVGDDGAAVSCPGTDSRCEWLANATAIPHTTSPSFPTVLEQALADVTALHLPKLDTTTVDLALDVLEFYGAETETRDPTSRFVGWAPQYIRWLSDLLLRGRGGSFPSPPGFTLDLNYAEPSVMDSARLKGARLYCAAREAQRRQSPATKSMGKLSAFSLDIFGSPVDFMTIEPTVVLDGPKPYLGGPPRCPIDPEQPCDAEPIPDDGSQAFVVPFLFGVQITPISFLPSLPELRWPVAMVSGDSEVETRQNLTPILHSPSFSMFRTGTHVDALLSTEGGGSAGIQETLFFIGPIEVILRLGLGIGVGQLYSSEEIVCPTGPDSLIPEPPMSVAPDNDRLLAEAPAGWPSAREGTFAGLFHDGPWNPSRYTADSPLVNSFFVESSEPTDPSASGLLGPSDPFLVRALQDDDRHSRHSSTLGLCGGIAGQFDADTGSMDIFLEAGGNLSGNIWMRHELRHAVNALAVGEGPQKAALPHATLSIAPRVGASVLLQLFVYLRIRVDLGDLFGVITLYDDDLVNESLPLAEYDSPLWEEQHRLRMGTGSPFGDPRQQPFALSHLPNRGAFVAHPTDVDTCLADDTPNPPAPPPCDSVPPALDEPPRAELCTYGVGLGQASFPPGVCSDIDDYVASLMVVTDEQRQCQEDRLRFLCDPVSQQQFFEAQPVVARVFDPSDTDQTDGLGTIIRQCAEAYVAPGVPDPSAAAEALAQSLFGFSLCAEDATLLTEPIGTVGDASEPPAVVPGTCM